MSAFFKETCKILGIRKVNTSSYDPSSNGMIERWHRSLLSGLSHFLDAANTNLDHLVSFLMAYLSTPNTTTDFSPYDLRHGREMVLPNSNDWKAEAPEENSDHDSRLEKLKSSLRLAHKSVKKANKKSHLKNKRFYDRKAKLRSFPQVTVYLYNLAKNPGKCVKFHKYWTGPFQITAKLSDFNYEIISMNNKTKVVHVNRLKIASNPEIWKPKQKSEK